MASVSLSIFHLALSKQFRSTKGERDRQSLAQNTFFRATTITITSWWVSLLTGSYIFSKPILACSLAPPNDILSQGPTACGIYQLILGVGVAALYVSL